MGCAKKLCENRKKKPTNELKSLDIRQRARCNSYSILFNLCGSPGFYHRCKIVVVVRVKEIECAFHFAASG